MRFRILISALLALASLQLPGQADTPSPTADEIVARMSARNAERETSEGGYTGTRQYALDNLRFDKHAQMVVTIICDPDGTKRFQVVSEEGWRSADKHVLRKMLESESETSRPTTRSQTRITSDNYSFQMLGNADLDGRPAYLIDAVPKREDKYLFRGRIWVDAEDYALGPCGGPTCPEPFLLDSQRAFHSGVSEERGVLVPGVDHKYQRSKDLRQNRSQDFLFRLLARLKEDKLRSKSCSRGGALCQTLTWL